MIERGRAFLALAVAWCRRDEVAVPLSVFLANRVLLYGLLSVFLGLLPNVTRRTADFWLLMRRWDGDWYYHAANDGYIWRGAETQSTAGFFPLFPLLGSAIGWLFGDPRPGLLLAVNLSFALFLFALYGWAKLAGTGQSAERAMFYAAAFPASLVTATFYSEATLLACAAATFLFLQRQRYAWAIGAAFFGALTRLPALALLFPLGFELASQRRWRWLVTALAIVPLAPALFSGYLWTLSGDPLAYFNVQRTAWFHEFRPPWETLRMGLERMTWDTASYASAVGLLEAGSIALFIVLAVGVWRWRPAGEFLYVLAIVAMTLVQTVDPAKGTPTQSAPRYLMAALPCFLVLARAGENRYVDQIIRWVFVGLQALFAAYFFAGFWVV